jgi:hypothetical protein
VGVLLEMKKILASTGLVFVLMSSGAFAATCASSPGSILCLETNGVATLPGGVDISRYNPFPDTPLYAGIGDEVFTASAGFGLKLTGDAAVTFTYLGSEAGIENLLVDGVRQFSSSSSVGGETFTDEIVGLGGFLNFSFRHAGQSIINGGAMPSNASIAFKVLTDTLDLVRVVAFLNDPGAGDADFDDMVILIEAKAPSKTDVPLPSGILLLMSGLAGLGYMGRARIAKKS